MTSITASVQQMSDAYRAHVEDGADLDRLSNRRRADLTTLAALTALTLIDNGWLNPHLIAAAGLDGDTWRPVLSVAVPGDANVVVEVYGEADDSWGIVTLDRIDYREVDPATNTGPFSTPLPDVAARIVRQYHRAIAMDSAFTE